MYRCTECQEEYKEKPEYCSCGNDEFEEITEIQSPKQVQTQKTPVSKQPQNWKTLFDKIFPIAFLIFCIILSIAIWLIKIPSSEKPVEDKTKSTTSAGIPTDVENFWQDTDKTSAPAPQKELAPSVQQPAQSSNSSSQKQNLSEKSSTSKPASTSATKPAAKRTSKTTTAKPSSSNQKSNNTNKPATTTNNQQTSQKPKLPDSVLNVGKSSPKTQSTNTTQTAQTAPKPFNYKPAPKMDEGEFLKYKGEIRSALLAKLNVTAIQGSGECAVEFSLDDTGKLINRIFVYKSSNKSVNDEVYLMLMRLPYYKKPPKYYNNEKIRLKFYFNNGYYEITFI